MSDALSSKLDSIQLEAERKMNWVKFIYSLIEDNLREYQGIFHTQEQEINLAKEIMFKEIERILERLIDKETRLFWVDIYNRKLNKLDEDNIIVNLWFAEFKLYTTRESMEKDARIHILWNKRRDVKKWFLNFLTNKKLNEEDVEITDDEIEYYINSEKWPHGLFLTQKWRDIINEYLDITWRMKLDVIKWKVNETREKLLSITCSI